MSTAAIGRAQPVPLDPRRLFKDSALAALVCFALALPMIGFETADVSGGMAITVNTRFGDVAVAVAVVFLGALFPLLINTHEGVRNADKLLINVVRSFGASGWDVARLVVIPNSLPFIVVGLRLAIGRAILGVVVAEFFGAQDGLGVVMVRAASSFDVNVVFAGLIVFAALSLVMTSLVKLVEDRMSRWRPQRAENE